MPSSVSQASVSAGLPPSSLAASECQASIVLGGNSAITRSLRIARDYTARRRASSIEGNPCCRSGLGGHGGKAIGAVTRPPFREIFFRGACKQQAKNRRP